MSEFRVSQPVYYAIYIKEHVPSRWSMWFEDLAITDLDNGGTILSGPFVDQPALHGLLAKVRDLNLTLIAVTEIEGPKTNVDPEDKG